ncbi:MAG: DUF418 domain-containing protein, partial [Brachybacterium sp.]|nr:DUF418 domain-containing protein [Brachybacterium sp.]
MTMTDAADGATTPTRTTRSLAPDLARGMMLLFIALANVSWFLWGHPASLTHAHPTDGTALDRVLQALMMIVVDARSYPMFAFLFGYGMVQFMTSRLNRGIDERTVRRMLRRRHWWLLAFGAVHAALLFYGDVLGAYAITGLLLVWIFFRRRDITLLIWSGIGLVLLGGYAVTSVIGGIVAAYMPASAVGMDADAAAFSVGGLREAAYGAPNYLSTIGERLSTWAMITPFQVIALSIPICVLLGWVAARRRYLDDPANHRRVLVRAAAIGIPVGWLGGVPSALLHLGVIDVPEHASFMFDGLSQVTGIFGGIGYAALFGLIALRWQEREARPPVLRAISAVGQRSLTFYLWQSLLFAPLFAAWGFGLGDAVGTAGALGIAVLVWAAGIGVAVWLDRAGRRGPAEVLLR